MFYNFQGVRDTDGIETNKSTFLHQQDKTDVLSHVSGVGLRWSTCITLTFSFILQAPWRLACSGLAETVKAATVSSKPVTLTGSMQSGTLSNMSVLETQIPGGLLWQRRPSVSMSWSTFVFTSVLVKLTVSSPGWPDAGSGMKAWPHGLKGNVDP